MTLQILHRDDLERGGFAGLREHRLVMNPQVFGSAEEGTLPGIGNFVYLADAKFIPNGETHLHPHKEIDVISVIVEGRIAHKGTLEEGNILQENQIQVQRAGGEGFAHNEVNPDNKENRMIQLWVIPEKSGEPAGYKLYDLQQGKVIRVYGGSQGQDETFPSKTVMDVGLLDVNQKITLDDKFIVYVTKGSGIIDGEKVSNGDLIQGTNLEFRATEETQIILISVEDRS
ncbi:pirin family protein [Nitrosopumilus sp.]|uniref:pirin family protein n=1 Tax=Nitrosopumilus sp. TaxID=2024843 RepID=UPI00292F5AFB|nr:pirin family protein [Nitrosopumilus sp.]